MENDSLNGIDFVEYQRQEAQGKIQHVLVVRFLKPLPDCPKKECSCYNNGAYGLIIKENLKAIRIEGGKRIVGIKPLGAKIADDHLMIVLDKQGDFSSYTLTLEPPIPEDACHRLDPILSKAKISFRASCPVDFDCWKQKICPPDQANEPLIDYMAKDYASFLRLMLDAIPGLNPGWLERNPADIGMALVELLAYAGDILSYLQDAVANEAYLDTARHRISAKRHAKLVNYAMHDGRNAWTFVHLSVGKEVSAISDQERTIKIGTRILSRICMPLQNTAALPGTVLSSNEITDESLLNDSSLKNVRVFETAAPVMVSPANNMIYIHTWGERECCLSRGATTAFLYSLDNQAQNQMAIRPKLGKDDFLIVEEVKSPSTGEENDADPYHRQVVQILDLKETSDPVYSEKLNDYQLQLSQNSKDSLPLLQVTWRKEDALKYPFCVSSNLDGKEFFNISIARSNMVLADHGMTMSEPADIPKGVEDKNFRLPLNHGPLTMQIQPEDYSFKDLKPRINLAGPASEVKPAITLTAEFPDGKEQWDMVPDLFESSAFDPHFVVEIEDSGVPILRFGDGEYGKAPLGATKFNARYRIGNGTEGNVGAKALAHIILDPLKNQKLFSSIDLVYNPLPAQDGVEPETIDHVRLTAPGAFHAEQLRAVTAEDYANLAKKMPGVAGAVAAFRWTGSWYTVFVGIDPLDPSNLITESGGRTRLDPGFERKVRAFLTRYRLAGYDLEIRSGSYVPLDIEIEICVDPYHFKGDVRQAVLNALSNSPNQDGSVGFFSWDNFTFGQPVYLSKLYSAVEAVEGVDFLKVTCFKRYGKTDNGELESGIIPVGAWEIARLDNDPNAMENGTLRILARGGK